MNKIKIYVNADHTIKDIDPLGFIPANGNGSAVIEMIAPFLASHSIYAMYRKPNGLSPERLLTYLADYTEEVDGETWNVWLSGVPETVIDIDSAVQQEFAVQLEDWFIEPEDGFLGTVQSSDDIDAYLLAKGVTPVEGDFIRVVVTNTDWEYLSTVWTDSGERIAAVESRVPVQLANLPVDPSITTTLPTVTPTNTELIISILNGKIGRVEAVARFVEQDLTTYVSVTAAEETDELYMLRAGVPKRITVSQIVAGGGGMTTAVYDIDENGIVDKAETLDDGAGNTLTAARAKIISDWMNQDLKDTASPSFVEINIGDTTLSYDNVNRVATLNYGNGVMLQLGEESYVFAVNKDTLSENLVEGQPASITGATGATPQFTGATTADDDLAHKTVGILTEDINFNAKGKITTFGLVRDIDTTGTSEGEVWAEGDFLYVGEKALTNVEPVKPLPKVEVGLVLVSNAGVGVIFVNVDKAHKLGYLSDVDTSTAIEGDILVKNVNNVYVPITYINRLLDGISDVNVPTPQVGEILQWNGIAWVNGDVVTQGAGKSITFWIEDIDSSVVPYETLISTPSVLPEEDDSAITNSGSGEVSLGGYITEELGRTKIEAGNWNFETFARVSSLSGDSRIVTRVYKQATGGTETELFNFTSDELDSLINKLYSKITTQAEFTILATDRLLIKYFAISTSVANRTITLVHSGTENATHIDTPLQTLHNDLAGLQGGNNTQRYHLLLTELNRLNNDLVEKDLSNNTTYPPVATITGNERIFSDDAGTPSKVTPNSLATYIGGLSGSVINTGKYYDTGLGAHDTALVKVFTANNTVDADLTLDILNTAILTDFYTVSGINKRIKIIVPSSLNDDTQNATLTIDSASGSPTVKNILVNGGTIAGSALLGKELDLLYTTDGFVLELESLSQNISYQAIADSTFGVVNPIDGGALMPLVKSVSVEQSVKGDLPTDIAEWTAVDSVDSSGTGVLINTADGVSSAPYTALTLTTANIDLYYKVRFRVTNSDATNLTIMHDNSNFINIASPVINQWYESGFIFTRTAVNDDLRIRHYYADAGTASGKVMEVDYIMVAPLANKPYENDTVAQLNARFTSYIPQSINDISSLDLDSTGTNLVNALSIENYTITGAVSTFTPTGTSMTVVSTGAGGIIKEFNVIPNTDYYLDYTLTSGDGGIRIYDDASLTTLLRTTAGTFNSGDNESIAIYLRNASATTAVYTDIIVSEGTTAEAYSEYNSSNFTVPTGISVGTSQDETKWVNDHYELERHNEPSYTLLESDILVLNTRTNIDDVYIQMPSDVILSASGNENSSKIETEFSSPSGAVFADNVSLIGQHCYGSASLSSQRMIFVVAKGTYANVGEAKTALAGTTIRYALSSPRAGVTVNSNGSVIQEKVTTLIQNGLWGLDYDVTYNLNSTAQIGTNVERINENKKGQDLLEVESASHGARLTVNEADIVDIESKTGFITVTQDVNLDDIESNSDASKVKTDFITVTQEVNLDDIETNSNASKVKTDFITVTEAVDLDKVEEVVTGWSGSLSIPTATVKPASNVTLSVSVQDYTYIRYSGNRWSVKIPIEELQLVSGFHTVDLGSLGIVPSKTTKTSREFLAERDSDTTLTVYLANQWAITAGSPANASSANATLTLTKIELIK